MPVDYLQKILTAKVYDVAVETPLELAPTLSRRLGNRVLLKREDEQPVFSFKLRGAYNKMAHLSPAERARGVIAASAGNHAQGVALAAQTLGCAATIVMPVTTPHIKIAAVEARGATVVLHGDSYSDAYAKALQLQKASRATFVHPYDDPDVIAGQGTIGMEILRQCPGELDAIFVAIGGGGLIGGIAAYVKRVRPEIKPPPPTGTNTAWIVRVVWRRISMPIVPCPAITSGSSYGCTNVNPWRRCTMRACAWASEYESPCSTTCAPRAATASTLMRGEVTGITITARQPSFCAASATPCA